jgi:hypothetical protein
MGKHKRSKKGRDNKVKEYNEIIRNHKNLEQKHSEIIEKLPTPLVIPEQQLNAMIKNYKAHQENYDTEKTDEINIE